MLGAGSVFLATALCQPDLFQGAALDCCTQLSLCHSSSSTARKGPIPVSASVLCAQEASSIVAWEQRPLWGQQCWWWDRAVLLWQSQCLCLFLRLPVTDG